MRLSHSEGELEVKGKINSEVWRLKSFARSPPHRCGGSVKIKRTEDNMQNIQAPTPSPTTIPPAQSHSEIIDR
jgi:hypothetical protein